MENLETRGYPLSQQPLRLVIATGLSLLLPFCALLYVCSRIMLNEFMWSEVGVLIGFFILGLLGQGLGHHRLFAHRSFRANRGLKIFLGICGCASGIGPVIWFSALHRRHHRFTDTPKDPHTPHISGDGFLGSLKVLWMSAFGFSLRFGNYAYYLMFPERDKDGISTEFRASVRDLTSDRDLMLIDKLYLVWFLVSFSLAGLVMVAITGDVKDFWTGFIWGGAARMSCNQLNFGLINIFGHSTGDQPYESGDESRNLYWFAPISGGETLHNNHHAFPWTAKAGLTWWQIDLNYYFLILFEKLGWATDVRVPTEAELASRRRPASG